MIHRNKLLALILLFLCPALACHLPSQRPTPTPTPPRIQITSTPIRPTPTPRVITPTPSPTPTPTPVSASPESPIFYIVQPGDTLSEIADKFDLEVADLVQANHLPSPDWILAGQQLLIAKVPITTPEPTLSGKQIIVVLSTQRAYAYEDGVLAHPVFIVASGLPGYPTVTGPYAIERKYVSTRMTGPGYDIPDVTWTMYFYKGYALHGAPWNHNLGTPGSHGCVNMSVEDAHWLYDWAPLGTPVLILP